jgi:putative nucleotidyltransferase with HDIG domain
MNPATPINEIQELDRQKRQQERLRVINPAGRYLDGVTSLPPAPTLVTELLTLFRDPDRDVDKVVQLISYEPSLTAQILRTCRSTFYAGEQPPGDIFEAVTRVGFYQVYCLVVSLFGAKTKAMAGADKGVNVDQLWRHSVAVAVAASIVAEEAGQTRAVAFTAGLLHDIGKLVLASKEKETYAKLIQRSKKERVLLTELERSVWLLDHAELGGELMGRWRLPPEIVAAVRYHHELGAAAPFEQLTAAVQIGDMLAHQLFAEDLAETDVLAPSTAALQILHLRPEDLPGLQAKAQSEMEKVKDLLEI